MKITTYQNAASFLNRTQLTLEANEAGNSLILGVCTWMASNPNAPTNTPCLKTVEDGDTLIIAAMMTPPHNLVLYGHQGDIETGANMLAEDISAERWHLPGILGPGEAPHFFAENWAKVTGERTLLEKKLMVYILREVNQTDAIPGRFRLADKTDSEVIAEWWFTFHQDIYEKADKNDAVNATMRHIAQRDLYLWDDGQPVSMAMTTRPTHNGISISMVYTPPKVREKGYATACVGTLSQLLLDKGWKFVSLFADMVNSPANRVYQKIGYKSVCEYSEYSIQKPAT